MTRLEIETIKKVSKLAWRQLWSGVWIRSNIHCPYFQKCQHFEPLTGTNLIFSRDEGHHSSGWWKNPDWERCFHLSICFRGQNDVRKIQPFDEALAKVWVLHLYGPWRRFIHRESPRSDEGKQLKVHHFRVWANRNWEPLIPQGEVYSRDKTPRGYKTTSEREHEASMAYLQACAKLAEAGR